MASLYSDQHRDLQDLLNRANDDSGATLLIPDLQRPYVWNPRQVIWLVDSLIRGWPFGTFLTWKVGKDDPVRELARPFWKVVDRTDHNGEEQVSKRNPPGSFQMVLDGQQRIQSLLLAVCGDAWGIRMYDRDWHAALSDSRPRGRQGVKHWSQATLCVNLEALATNYARTKRILALDFSDILQWAVTGGKTAQSEFNKRENYNEPLPLTHRGEHQGRYIRLSRFWQAAPDSEGVDPEQANELAENLLKEHDVTADNLLKWTRPVGALLMTLTRVKKTRITYLEVSEFDQKIFTREAYNDAVVNIFTRLNTAGRTLTRQDITFAWLKTNWDPTLTGNRNASQCFEQLGYRLSDEKLELSTEDLVAGVSFVWSTVHAGGRLLSSNDLLKGEAIRPMATDLSRNWFTLTNALLNASALVLRRGHVNGETYGSLNSIFVLWSCQYISALWLAAHPLRERDHDSFVKMVRNTLDSFIDRWLMNSQWAGRWASSADTVAGYAKRLHDCSSSVLASSTADQAVQQLHAFLEVEVESLEQDAIGGLGTIEARRRELVRHYYGPLWIWHRLNPQRWAMSKVQLRTDKSANLTFDVDHAVAHAIWERKIEATPPASAVDAAEALAHINKIGNCSLLEKSFNISKSDQTLRSFLEEVYEFKEKKILLNDWAAALGLHESMLDADVSDVDTLWNAIELRDQAIRKDLHDFITGKLQRVDLPS